jgi:hypothetical protein
MTTIFGGHSVILPKLHMYIVSYTMNCVIVTLITHFITLKLYKYVKLQMITITQNYN